jgi:quinol monooxygenase YgiN
MKYVIGWLKLKPQKRDAFFERIRPFATMSRSEPGVHVFEVAASDIDPEVAVFTEAYASEEAHTAHLETPEHRALLTDLQAMSISGKFIHIYPERSRTDEFSF